MRPQSTSKHPRPRTNFLQRKDNKLDKLQIDLLEVQGVHKFYELVMWFFTQPNV